ncbi:MAG: hypothetical protein HQL66_06055 [Magnetococcales bacterium]|nr:hypothetical protein [Magnetococcales bacterium]
MGRSLPLWVGLLLVVNGSGGVAAEVGSFSFQRAGVVAKPNCPSCHAWLDNVEKPRPLVAPHNLLTLAHGRGRLWCLDCHATDAREKLRAGGVVLVDWEEADRGCAVCHGRQVTAWQAGIHGKRVGSWRGPRVVLRCAQCHDPHQPAPTSWLPDPPPPRVRQGAP